MEEEGSKTEEEVVEEEEGEDETEGAEVVAVDDDRAAAEHEEDLEEEGRAVSVFSERVIGIACFAPLDGVTACRAVPACERDCFFLSSC